MFAYVGTNGVVKNVTVKDSYFSSYGKVGCVVGVNRGSVENCSNAGTLFKRDTYSGGVVGYNSGTVKGCSNSGTLTSFETNVGGVVGFNEGKVMTCYNTAMINGNKSVGGIVGQNADTVKDCYNTGDIGGSIEVGGMVGCNFNGAVSPIEFGSVINCYNTGKIYGDYNSAGAVVGSNEFDGCGTVTNCYYLSGCAKCGGIIQYGIGTAKSGASSSDVEGQTVEYSETAFNSGIVAYLLNGSASEDELVWKQTIDTDKYPNFTGKTVLYNENNDPQYYNEKTDIIIVDISWTSMNFTYTDGEYSTESHKYGDGKWNTDGGVITVENNGNVDIKANFVYTTENDISGSFTKQNMTVAVGESDSTQLSLSGKPSEEMEKAPLGQITVSVSKNE